MPMDIAPRLCMRCGWICSYMDIEEPILICEFCNNKLIEAPLSAREYFNENKFSERLKLEKQWLETIIKPNPDFDGELYQEQIKWNINKMNTNYSLLPQQVVCPKCTSNQITVLRKKWSLLTGFLTNKTERVCARCGHRF